MNKNHRYFIQFMIKNGVSTLKRAQEFCKHISDGDISNQTDLKSLILEINRHISQQCFKIVYSTCEVTNNEIVVWLNTRNDDISKFQVSYSALELEYFHTILQEILNSIHRFVSNSVSINISARLTAPMSRDNAEKVLAKWLKGGYYVNMNDNIYLGPRLILEFMSYLKTYCSDSICTLCSELVFYGKQCIQCIASLHSHCLTKYLKSQTDCPSCHKLWIDTTVYVNGTQELVSTDNEHVSITPSRSRQHSEENDTFNNEPSMEVDEETTSVRRRYKRMLDLYSSINF